MKNPIKCWNCSGLMVFYGHGGYYDFFKCPLCGKEKALPKEENDTRDSAGRATKQISPTVFPGSISGDSDGERDEHGQSR